MEEAHNYLQSTPKLVTTLKDEEEVQYKCSQTLMFIKLDLDPNCF